MKLPFSAKNGKNEKISSNKHCIAGNFSKISENEILKKLPAINMLLLTILSFIRFFAEKSWIYYAGQFFSEL